MNQKLSRRTVAKAIAARLVEEPQRRSHWVKVLAAYIVDNKLQDSVDLVLNDVLREIHAISGQLLVEVTTARPLTESLRGELQTILRDALKAQRIALQESTNPEVLGGFIARTSDVVLDASVRTKLRQLASI